MRLRSVLSSSHAQIIAFLNTHPQIPFSLGLSYAKAVFAKTKICSHIGFLKKCLRFSIIPRGFYLKHSPSSLTNKALFRSTQAILRKTSRQLLVVHLSSLNSALLLLNQQLFTSKRALFWSVDSPSYSSFKMTVAQANSNIYGELSQSKARKWTHLLLSQSPRPSHRWPAALGGPGAPSELETATCVARAPSAGSSDLAAEAPPAVAWESAAAEVLPSGMPSDPGAALIATAGSCDSALARVSPLGTLHSAAVPSPAVPVSDEPLSEGPVGLALSVIPDLPASPQFPSGLVSPGPSPARASAQVAAAGASAVPGPSQSTAGRVSSVGPRLTVHTVPPDLPLSEAERSVLSKGLKFVPSLSCMNKFTLLKDCSRFFRRIRWTAELGHPPKNQAAFSNDIFTRLFKKPSFREPPRTNFEVEYFIKKCSNDIQNLKLRPLFYSNLSREERLALQQLRKRDDLVIKPADKGGAVVVWRRDLYIAEAQRQLQNPSHYKLLDEPSLHADHRRIRLTINRLISDQQLPTSAKLLIPPHPRQSVFYLLPKIHKLNNPGRPIVSTCSCPTEFISTYLDSILQPLVQSLPTYVKDSTHTLHLIEEFNSNPQTVPTYLFTLDVQSLYTSIPHQDGLKALSFFLDQRPILEPPTSTLLRLAELVLTLNTFSFDNHSYSQVKGVAMGTKMGPSYACLFMGHFEHLFLQQFRKPHPDLFKRYIDDCFAITSQSLEETTEFIQALQVFHPSISFTYQISAVSVSFLDIHIFLSHGHLRTSVHYKPTDTHAYLHYHSFHNPSTLNSIPYSQFLRLRRLCSDNRDFHEKSLEMIKFFQARHYPLPLLHQALHRVQNQPRELCLRPRPKLSTSDRPILALQYHPATRAVRNIIRSHWHLLQSTDKLSTTFPSPPLISYKRGANLRNLLTHSSLPKSVASSPGTSPCNDPTCKTCPFIASSTSIQAPKCTFHIKRSFTCHTYNLVYALQCTHSQCQKIYIGETGRTLHIRFQEHIADIKHSRPRPVALHFNTTHHDWQGIRVRGLWLMHNDDPGERKEMETRLIDKLGTRKPFGLNER